MYNERDSFIIFSLKIFLFEKYILNHMGPFVHKDFFLANKFGANGVITLPSYYLQLRNTLLNCNKKVKVAFLFPSILDIPWKLCFWQQVAILALCAIKKSLLFVELNKLTAVINKCNLTWNYAQLGQNSIQVTAEKYVSSYIS